MKTDKSLERIIEDNGLLNRIYGNNFQLIESKKIIISNLWNEFISLFSAGGTNLRNIFITIVPNRVEILGKHTDYQGGRTVLLTGPKSFISISRKNSSDSVFKFINYTKEYGRILIGVGKNNELKAIEKGLGWKYSLAVIKRMLNNFPFFRIDPIESIFYGDIPIGGGTSGSSAKVIMDFFNIAITNGLLNNDNFVETIIENGKYSGILYNQKGVDNFKLALSMYIANYENGLDYGNLKGDKGVGTFGGSEDHTAILLGEKDKIMLCRYCPTQLIARIDWPKDYSIIVAFSGKKAEKTINAKEKYNRLSLMASEAVKILNSINKTEHPMLRDFYKELPIDRRAELAFKQLKQAGYKDLAERAFQFFKEEEIIEKAVTHLSNNRINNFGEYIDESHKLSKIYLKNIVNEIDFLQNSAKKLGAVGASGFGAGFGGSCYSIVKSSDAQIFIKEWKNSYLKKYPQYEKVAEFEIYPPCSGVSWEKIHD